MTIEFFKIDLRKKEDKILIAFPIAIVLLTLSPYISSFVRGQLSLDYGNIGVIVGILLAGYLIFLISKLLLRVIQKLFPYKEEK